MAATNEQILKISGLADQYADEQLNKLIEFCSIDCKSGDKEGNSKVVAIADAFLNDLGAEIEHVEGENGINVVGRIRPEHPAGKIILQAHLDTVFDKGSVQKHPCRVDGEILHGLGVSDCKGGVVTILYAVKIAKEAGLLPNKEIVMLFNCDEEIGSPTAQPIFRRESVGCDGAYCFEPGRNKNGIITYRPGCVEGHIRVKGITQHSQFANEDNSASAVHELCNLVCQLLTLNDKDKGLFFDVCTIQGGERECSVAESAEAYYIADLTKNEYKDEINEKLQVILPSKQKNPKCKVDIDTWFSFPALERNEGTLSLYEEIRKAGLLLGYDLPEEHTYASGDANFYCALGCPVVDGLGPYMYDMHTFDERIIIRTLNERTKLFATYLAGMR